ncbi:hypothetical protein HWV62_15609 [Athelia sp. TMB]|nr:hypothetical protein HWV62_15609 [Athelia sp. TMB]
MPNICTHYIINGAVENTPKRAVWEEIPRILAEEFHMFKFHHNSYTITTFPANTTKPGRHYRFEAFGSMFALYTLSTNRGPPQTSFALLLAMLLQPHQLIRLPIDYIRVFDAEAAQLLEPWARLAKNTPFPKTHSTHNSIQQTELLNLLYQLEIPVTVRITPFNYFRVLHLPLFSQHSLNMTKMR